MEHEHLSYPEAIRYLAKKYSIEIEETRQTEYEKSQNNDRESLYLISKFACEFFEKCLCKAKKNMSTFFEAFIVLHSASRRGDSSLETVISMKK